MILYGKVERMFGGRATGPLIVNKKIHQHFIRHKKGNLRGIFMKKKRIVSFFLGTLLATAVFAQDAKQPEIEAKEELKAPVSEEMASIQTALQLAEYGYKNGSASSLLCAAEILAQVPKQEMETKATQDESGTKETQSEKNNIPQNSCLLMVKNLQEKTKLYLRMQRMLKNW